HEIASHGYFHKDHSKMNYEQNLAEIRPSVKLLNAMLGYDIALFAPPSGAFNDATVTAATSLNLKTIMWSRDTIDWRDSDVSLICNRATNGLENGEFILMHPMDVTVKALPQILDYIRENGLSAVTVSYNLGE
ncbi:MAG: polysaccharide deacetylase family protein, partial [Clostridia bacterium]|nr:polysaccharide deacetylase family protein [Clostridia bacterium]